MSDSLSTDLASLKIDRQARPKGGHGGHGAGGPLKALLYVAAIAALGFVAWTQGAALVEQKLFKPQVEVTEIALVSPAQAQVSLTSTGYVVPQVRSQVGAKVPGRVAQVFVKEGDQVKAGQVLMTLDRVDAQAAMNASKARSAAARARVLTARANVSEVERQAAREKVLAQNGAAPASRAEDLEGRAASLREMVKAAQAEVAAADAELAATRVAVENLTITAPMDGTILDKPPEAGELVGPDMGIGTGSSTIELADLGTIMVETDVPESRLNLVKMGSPAEIVLDAYPDRRYRGEAVGLLPRINRAKATVGVKVKFVDVPENVLPDMAARVSFLTAALDESKMKEKPKTIVPGAAVAEREGAKVVFVLEGDQVRITPVTLGAAFGDGFELVSGPLPGTKVIKAPAATLADGAKVKEKTAS
jgi:HlyD family secretion protein